MPLLTATSTFRLCTADIIKLLDWHATCDGGWKICPQPDVFFDCQVQYCQAWWLHSSCLQELQTQRHWNTKHTQTYKKDFHLRDDWIFYDNRPKNKLVKKLLVTTSEIAQDNLVLGKAVTRGRTCTSATSFKYHVHTANPLKPEYSPK